MPTLVSTGAATERAAFFHPPALSGVEVLHVDGAAREWKGVLEAYSITLPIAGAGRLRYRRQERIGEAGSLALLDPGELFSCAPAAVATRFRVLRLAPALVLEAAGLPPGSHRLPSFGDAVVRNERLAREVARLHHSLLNPASTLEREGRLVSLLAALSRTLSPFEARTGTRHEHRAVRRAREYLHAHWQESISLDQLAKLGNLNKFYFSQLFKRAVGSPPHEYQTLLRLERARALLAGGRSASVVAAEVGFSDQRHLNRHFRRAYGLTPGAYARAR